MCAVVQLVQAVHYKPEGHGFNSWWGCYFSLTWSFRLHYGPGVHLAPNRNEYQGCLLVGKAADVCDWQPYHHHVPTVYKFWKPQPPTACRACPGLYWDSFTFSLLITGCTLSLVASDDIENTVICWILCFVDHTSLYNLINKANLVHNFS